MYIPSKEISLLYFGVKQNLRHQYYLTIVFSYVKLFFGILREFFQKKIDLFEIYDMITVNCAKQ